MQHVAVEPGLIDDARLHLLLQYHIINKDEFGISTIESLHAKGPKIRSDASFDKDYLLGRYGGIPKLGTQLNMYIPAKVTPLFRSNLSPLFQG
jgi:hypothetical protein